MSIAAATATFSLPLRDTQVGDINYLIQWAITSPNRYENPILIGAGNTSITDGVSSSTAYNLVILIPPTGLTDTWKLKGAGGDSGVVISSASPTILSGAQSGFFFLNVVTGGYTIKTIWI